MFLFHTLNKLWLLLSTHRNKNQKKHLFRWTAAAAGACTVMNAIKYDATKEERYQQEAKQRELQRIEEALQTAERREKSQEEKKDTFMEKLATQVIKNLQVKISRIHLRYEDDVSTDPELGPGSSPVFWCIRFLGTFLNLSFTDVCFSCQSHSAPYRWE
ncbi:hypothetical protein GOODEAATRI_003486 [Goodea atripinnis]|uniref:Chorein N-terminal domain-containing protein n=1 Tax=Goodea atripinnis TaxID=208336 RepID=A0ABV0MEU1_9TELE